MRLAHLLVLHGPHLDLLGEGPLAGHPRLQSVDRALELAVSTGVAGVRFAQGDSEAELVAALHKSRDWATHVLVSPAALAPTAYVLREALALVGLPFAELFVDALPDSALHARLSVLREKAMLQKRGTAPGVYVEVAEKLLGAKLIRQASPAALLGALPAVQTEPRAAKELGRARPKAPTPAPQRAAKTIGRKGRAAESPRVQGVTRASVRQQIAGRLSGKLSPAQLATWGREQWLAVERGSATESGQRELLAETLQALALSATPGAQLTDPELLELMARMG